MIRNKKWYKTIKCDLNALLFGNTGSGLSRYNSK